MLYMLTIMTNIAERLNEVRCRMAQACAAAGRPVSQVRLLAVSKTFGVEAVAKAIEAGQEDFGENYLPEGAEKVAYFAERGRSLQWHMIGPLQSNKTRMVAESFHWVHTVDRVKVAERLSEQRPAAMPDLEVCLEVNVSGEESKSGVTPEELPALAAAVMRLPHLQLRGLMCIPAPARELAAQRRPFAQLRGLMEDLQRAGYPLDTLSMGMSDDLEAAILEGATIVRVGRAIFGERHYAAQEADRLNP